MCSVNIDALNSDVNEILPVCSKFFVRFECKSIQEICVEVYWEMVSSVNVLGDGEFLVKVLGDGEFRVNVPGDGEFHVNVLGDGEFRGNRRV